MRFSTFTFLILTCNDLFNYLDHGRTQYLFISLTISPPTYVCVCVRECVWDISICPSSSAVYLHHNHTIVTTPSHTPPPYDSHHTSSPIHTTPIRFSPHIIFITHHIHLITPHHTSLTTHQISITHHIHLQSPSVVPYGSPHCPGDAPQPARVRLPHHTRHDLHTPAGLCVPVRLNCLPHHGCHDHHTVAGLCFCLVSL